MSYLKLIIVGTSGYSPATGQSSAGVGSVNMYHLHYFNRRGSQGIISNQDEQRNNSFPRRHSYMAPPPQQPPQQPPKKPVLSRRYSAFSLPEIQKQQQTTKRKQSLKKNFSMICFPKELIDKAPIPEKPKLEKSISHDDSRLHRIPSVTPEPDVIRLASRNQSNLSEEDFKNGAYRPKYCWCMRCQLMYSMYKAGDDRLAIWGNYPCFRR